MSLNRPMLSVIVLCNPIPAAGRPAIDGEAVVRTLSALVSALVRGLVRDVVIAGPEAARLEKIADHAGCAFVEAEQEWDRLGRALALVRGEELLVLHAGHIPETGFVEEVEEFLAHAGRAEARRIYAAPMTYWQRLIPTIAPIAGLIAPVTACRAAAASKELTFAALLRATRSNAALRARLRRVR
jgi:hypothetical protein